MLTNDFRLNYAFHALMGVLYLFWCYTTAYLFLSDDIVDCNTSLQRKIGYLLIICGTITIPIHVLNFIGWYRTPKRVSVL